MDIKSIYEGWKYLIWKDPEHEKIAKERYDICAGFNGKQTCPKFRKGTKQCKVYGCYIPAKVRAMDKKNKCPLNKW